MPWMIREDQLDPDQREFIDNSSRQNNNVWIRGFAGSGKSVLLVHSLRDVLAREPNANVVVIVFTHSLKDLFETGIHELNLPTEIPVMTYYEFYRNEVNYDYIFCDEVQDLPERILRKMRLKGRKIIVAGDSNQSIYDSDPQWKEPTVKPEAIGHLLDASAFNLNIIHRLTRSIINAIKLLMPAMNSFGDKRDMTRQDVSIRLCKAMNNLEEVEYVYEEALKGANVGDSSIVLFPKRDLIIGFANSILASHGKSQWNRMQNRYGKADFASLNYHLEEQIVRMQVVGNGYGSLESSQRNGDIILMTYHSAKGLDFDNVFLPFLNSELSISPNNEKTLFMVAMTRSRKNLYLSYHGRLNSIVNPFMNECTEINISEQINTQNQNNDIYDF